MTAGFPALHADPRDRLAGAIPKLRAFAISLARDVTMADDLVQDTILKAWSNIEKFDPATNLDAWLFTILRNTYFSLHRKRGREVQDSSGIYAERLAVAPQQDGVLDLADFRVALGKLPSEQREVLIMVGASGLSYEEVADICGVAVGTVKSRVNRARNRLAKILGIRDAGDLGPDRNSLTVIQGAPTSPLP